jgi:tRNA threonylcarbamoyladenosine modification (KEOPS) complex  Pcc1 subunit
MKVLCTVTLEFESAKKAKKILQSIQADDQGFVKSTTKGKTLQAVVESTSVPSLIHTLDDYLACISVADDIVNKH